MLKSNLGTKFLNDFLGVSQIIEGDLSYILNKYGIKVFETEKGHAINNDDYIMLLNTDEVYKSRLQGLINSSIRDKNNNENNSLLFKNKIKNKINECQNVLDRLIKIHKKYNKEIKSAEEENARVAAYVIMARIINLLWMASVNIQLGYANTLILFRPVMESVILSNYFLVTKDTMDGKKKIKEWFREDKTPRVSDMRVKFEEFSKEHLTEEIQQKMEGLLFILHQRLSKSIHNSYVDIRRLFKPIIENNVIEILEFDYKSSSRLFELLEMTLYLESVIYTAVLTFIKNFELHEKLLENDDIDELRQIQIDLIRKFEHRWTDLDFSV